MHKIMHQVVIESDPATIFAALTTQDGLSKWWIADCEVKPEEGFVNEFHIEGHGTTKMKVTSLKPNQLVEWQCQNDDDWSQTEIRFCLRQKDSGCVLSFEHDGWREQSNFFATCSYHWARHLGMLAKYCETGNPQVDRAVERDEVRKVMSD